jgi:hypothetical protein
MRLLFVGFLLLLCSSTGFTQVSLGKNTLSGLKAVRVVIEDFGPKLGEDGLDKDQVQQDVELRLRQSRIKVVSKETARTPYLYVRIGSFRLNTGAIAFSIAVSLRQYVLLERRPSIKEYADTSFGPLSTGVTKTIKDIRGALAENVDSFINDYLEVNTP